MATLVFGLNQSLDGYVDHQEFAPGPSLFRHFTEQVRDLAGSVYGRRMYEVMRYCNSFLPLSSNAGFTMLQSRSRPMPTSSCLHSISPTI